MVAARRIFLLVFAIAVGEAHGQNAVIVDPYRVLYDRKLPPRAPVAEGAMDLPATTQALIQTRLGVLIARAQFLLESSRDATGAPPWFDSAEWQGKVRKIIGEAMNLRARGALLGSQEKAFEALAGAEIAADFSKLNSRVDEVAARIEGRPGPRGASVRERIEAVCRPLDDTQPTTVSSTVARLEALEDCVQVRVLLDEVDAHSDEILRRLIPGDVHPAEQSALLMRLMVEVLGPPLIELLRDQISYWNQLGLTDPTDTARPLLLDEAAIRRLAIAYEDGARANASLLASETESRALPALPSDRQWRRRFNGLVIEKQLAWAIAHRKDRGPAAALAELAAAFGAYRAEVGTIALLDSVGVSIGGKRFPSAPTAGPSPLLGDWARSARGAGAQAKSLLGSIPPPVIVAYRSGRELVDGGDDSREEALFYLVYAAADAQLSVALGAARPDATAPAEGGPDADAVRECIARLNANSTLLGKATGVMAREYGAIPAVDRQDIILDTIMRVCTRAEDLSTKIEPLFWRQLNNRIVDWYRTVAVQKRAFPKLFASCDVPSPNPEREVLDGEDRDRIREALCEMSQEDRRVLQLFMLDDLGYAEIGRRLGVGEEAARKRVRRALDRLNEAYRARDPFGLRPLRQNQALPS